jgi:hypothetical protein
MTDWLCKPNKVGDDGHMRGSQILSEITKAPFAETDAIKEDQATIYSNVTRP